MSGTRIFNTKAAPHPSQNKVRGSLERLGQVQSTCGKSALHTAGGNAVNERILRCKEDDQLRDDGNEGQGQDAVPAEAVIRVHGQLDEDGHGVLAGGGDVEQRAHKVVAAPHELEQAAGHQRGAQHGADDLVQRLDRAAAVNGGRFVQVVGDAAHELNQ